ncbi:MAG: hypothetical protein GKS02_13850 [Alphaproteobacteria bacterium]|nr:hypothetical protein [Alphaproteobacteria bacterium]
MDRLPSRNALLAGLTILFSALAGTSLPAASDDAAGLSPERVGSIDSATSEAELRKIFGPDRVRDHRVQVGEGFVCQGTRIDLPDGDSLEITWLDADTRARPDTINVLGKRRATGEGLRLGSTLQELEKINGARFNLSGFGWDYGGTVGTWNGGSLDYLTAAGRPRMIVRLAPKREAYQRINRSERAAVSGDGALVSSGHSAMQALTPRVSQIIVDFAAGDCAAFFPE